MPGRLDAVVFDMDGTIVDTEAVIYRSIATVFEEHGVDFPMDRWARLAVGTVGQFDWRTDLVSRAGGTVDLAAAEDRQAELEAVLMRDVVPRPGVVALVEECAAAGVALSVCSNSRTGWARQQVERAGLIRHFNALFGRDRFARPKPDPVAYDTAARGVGADPHWSVAIEDSAAGVASAVGAGLATIVCPTPMTAGLDLSAAHLRVVTLEGVSLERLRTLLAEVRAGR